MDKRYTIILSLVLLIFLSGCLTMTGFSEESETENNLDTEMVDVVENNMHEMKNITDSSFTYYVNADVVSDDFDDLDVSSYGKSQVDFVENEAYVSGMYTVFISENFELYVNENVSIIDLEGDRYEVDNTGFDDEIDYVSNELSDIDMTDYALKLLTVVEDEHELDMRIDNSSNTYILESSVEDVKSDAEFFDEMNIDYEFDELSIDVDEFVSSTEVKFNKIDVEYVVDSSTYKTEKVEFDAEFIVDNNYNSLLDDEIILDLTFDLEFDEINEGVSIEKP